MAMFFFHAYCLNLKYSQKIVDQILQCLILRPVVKNQSFTIMSSSGQNKKEVEGLEYGKNQSNCILVVC